MSSAFGKKAQTPPSKFSHGPGKPVHGSPHACLCMHAVHGAPLGNATIVRPPRSAACLGRHACQQRSLLTCASQSAWSKGLRTLVDEVLPVLRDVREVLQGLGLGRGTQTLVVLDGPARGGSLFPLLVLWHGEEGELFVALCCLPTFITFSYL